jgi:hypothetical protein
LSDVIDALQQQGCDLDGLDLSSAVRDVWLYDLLLDAATMQQLRRLPNLAKLNTGISRLVASRPSAAERIVEPAGA